MIKVAFYSQEANSDLIYTILDKNKNFILDLNNFEVLFVLGGDGIFLDALKRYHQHNIKIILINTGKLGFLESDINLENMNVNDNKFETFPLLKMTIDDEEQIYSFNEFILSTKNNPIKYDIFVNKKFFYSFFGSGFWVSTKYGSTGWNRSMNGPIITNSSQFIFSEYLPVKSTIFNYLNQSVVLTENDELSIRLKTNYIQEINLKIDGQTQNFISKNIKIKLSKSIARIYKINQVKWFKKIQEKIIGSYDSEK